MAARPRGRFLLLVLVLLGVTLVTLSDRSGQSGIFQKARSYARQVVNPLQSAVHSALQPVGDFIEGAVKYHELESQNQDLRQQLLNAQGTEVAAEAEQNEAEAVLGQQQLSYLAGIPSIAAEVVATGSANFEQTIEINRGSDSGVTVGQPVVSAGGLVGSVSAVSGRIATVTLLDDPSFTVGVRVEPSLVVGAAVGEGAGNTLQIVDVNVGEAVKKGDWLVTSGLDVFPPGIPVGQVTAASSPAGVLQQQISMEPLADLVNLQFVRVLLWSSQ
ncbi:MAG TPA: rod shape-determining protein MreC [Acidimicrobiales bacterium]|nr:rod shape-determining protein MreC [Acidimicrobiales bacterium]